MSLPRGLQIFDSLRERLVRPAMPLEYGWRSFTEAVGRMPGNGAGGSRGGRLAGTGRTRQVSCASHTAVPSRATPRVHPLQIQVRDHIAYDVSCSLNITWRGDKNSKSGCGLRHST